MKPDFISKVSALLVRAIAIGGSCGLPVMAENNGLITAKELLLDPSEYSLFVTFSVEVPSTKEADGRESRDIYFYFGRWQTNGFFIQGPSRTEISEIVDQRQLPVAGMAGDLIWYADALGIHRSRGGGSLDERAAKHDPVAMNSRSSLLLFLPMIKCGVLPLKIGSLAPSSVRGYVAMNTVDPNSQIEIDFQEDENATLVGIHYATLIGKVKARYRVDLGYDRTISPAFPSVISTYYLGNEVLEMIRSMKVLSIEIEERLSIEEYLPERVLKDRSASAPLFSTIHSNGVSYFLNASGNLEPIQQVGFAARHRGLIGLIAVASISLALIPTMYCCQFGNALILAVAPSTVSTAIVVGSRVLVRRQSNLHLNQTSPPLRLGIDSCVAFLRPRKDFSVKVADDFF